MSSHLFDRRGPRPRVRRAAGLGALLAGSWMALSAPAAGAPTVDVEVHATTRQISASGSLPFDLWVVNRSDEPLNEAKVALLAPAELRWTEAGCAAAAAGPIDLGPLPAHAVAHRRLRLCAGESLVEGSYSLGFALEHGWGEGRKAVEVATLEVQLLLFPAQTALGAPLAAAALVLPGLCFLAALRLLKFPRIESLGGTESTVAAVALSVALGAALTALPGRSAAALPGRGVSPERLFFLMAAAALLGLLFHALVAVVRRAVSAYGRRFTVAAGDGNAKMLERALRAYGPEVNETRVTLAGGEGYVGSHALEGVGGRFVVLGWFRLSSPSAAAPPAGRRALLRGLAEGTVEDFDTVKKVTPEGTEEDAQRFVVWVDAAQVVGTPERRQSAQRPPAVAFKG